MLQKMLQMSKTQVYLQVSQRMQHISRFYTANIMHFLCRKKNTAKKMAIIYDL